MEVFPAHIRTNAGQKNVQTVQAHCRGAAEVSRSALSAVGMGSAAYLAGLLHDAGKFTNGFRNYLLEISCGKTPRRGSVNHTFAGVRYFLQHYHTPKNEDDCDPIVAELLAYAVGAHHGLFDCVDAHGMNGFQHRLEKPGIDYEAAIGQFLAQCADQQELDRLFDEAVQELKPVMMRICDLAQQDEAYDGEVSFYLGLLARLLLSAVIEGDRMDTSAFLNGFDVPQPQADRRPLWVGCLQRAEEKLAHFPLDSPIALARKNISDQCRSFAERPGGVFRLNVPTGGGKTLSSLRYALAHAARWNKSRIIFTAPLLSILDQNAQVLRSYIQDDSLILEHHSNVVRPKNDSEGIVQGTDGELMAENWNAPVIITTLVQLLNTLFSGRTTCIRRFQALVNSVIVIDEVQTVPNRMLALFNLAVNFLSQICGATVVLCSATQPCLERTPHPITVPMADIVPYDPKLWTTFRRTTLDYAGTHALEEIRPFVLDRLEHTDSLLVICNKKSEAERLYRELAVGDFRCFHLSAAMCMAHRRAVLDEMQTALKRPGKTVCVATQVVEAGVDISFGCVVRLTAGLDSIIQAAGRCNRNGESPEPAPVYILDCAGERLSALPDIQRAKDAMVSLLAQFRQQPGQFYSDLSSLEAVRWYYQQLYRGMPQGFQEYPMKGKPTLYSLLSLNGSYQKDDNGFALNQAFRQAGALFQVFDEETTDVIVPYGTGVQHIAELCSERARDDPVYLKRCLDQVRPYTVSLFQYQKAQLAQQGGLYTACEGNVLLLRPQWYDEHTGVLPEAAQNSYLEVY